MNRLAFAFVPLVLTLAPAAFAQDKATCLVAVDEGQNLRDQGKVAQAKAQFQLCSSKSCPAAVTKQCSDWYAELEKEQPSVLFRARDGATNKELVDVKVIVDGKVVTESISAQPLALDPGAHVIRFERKDGTSLEEKLLLRIGEKARMIELTFRGPDVVTPKVVTPPPAAPEKKPFTIPLLGWVGGGVFVAGAATTVIFAVMANGDESDLRSTCAPSCNQDDRDSIKTKIVVANVGMFVGIAGLALAGVTTFMANRPEKATARTARPRVRFGLTASGIGGTF